MVRLITYIISLYLVSIALSNLTWSRPEYATREKLNCTACHFYPWGGGPRTVLGKTFGSHGYPLSAISSSDLYYGDLRFIGYYPTQKFANSAKGSTVMEAAASVSLPLVSGEKSDEIRALATYNIAPLSSANLRDAFIRWRPSSDPNPASTYFSFGQFYMPFGLLTDEHRTYTKLQTNSTINIYTLGAALSWNYVESVHSDLALLNDLQGAGFVSNNITWGAVYNMRWNPESLPFLLGASGNWQRTFQQDNPYAVSLYGVFSFDRLTTNSLSGSISIERVDSWNWNSSSVNTGQINPNLIQFFLPSSAGAYIAKISNAPALGYYLLARYNPLTQLTLFYKMDYLNFDKASADDNSFFRHGFGVESYISSNLILNLRYEFTNVPMQFNTFNTLGIQNDIFFMLRVWV